MIEQGKACVCLLELLFCTCLLLLSDTPYPMVRVYILIPTINKHENLYTAVNFDPKVTAKYLILLYGEETVRQETGTLIFTRGLYLFCDDIQTVVKKTSDSSWSRQQKTKHNHNDILHHAWPK